jgi:hypothetical protein
MPAISRLYDFQAGDIILSSQVDNELNQLINTVNSLPDKDGNLQINLNADLLDGKHMSSAGGNDTIPLCDATTIQVQLNADLLDGQHASDIAAAAFDVGTKIPFYQASPPSGWDEATKPTDHVLGWKTGQAGGTKIANSWTVGGLTVTINGHSLTIAELASHTHGLNNHSHSLQNHTHDINWAGAPSVLSDFADNNADGATVPILSPSGTGNNDTGVPSVTNTGNSVGNTASNGSGSPHNHTGSVSQDGSWRPPTAYVIIGVKA